VFDIALAALGTDADAHPAMEPLQAKVRTIAALVRDEATRGRIERVIQQRSWGLKHALFVANRDWVTQKVAGRYGGDWLGRTAANLFALWSNVKQEVVCFKAGTLTPLRGNHAHAMTFAGDMLPSARVRYFWSVGYGDSVLTSRSRLQLGNDGSLTLYFAPERPLGAPEANWLATPPAQHYVLTWRSYGADEATVTGRWFPPPLQRI
jgi:hypothetical protein